MECKGYWERYNELHNEYIALKNSLISKHEPIPPWGGKFIFFLAHENAWRYINRAKLTPHEIESMKQMEIYKPSRTEMGIPRQPNKNRIYLSKSTFFSVKDNCVFSF